MNIFSNNLRLFYEKMNLNISGTVLLLWLEATSRQKYANIMPWVIGVRPSQPINLIQFSPKIRAILPSITLFSVSKRAL